MPLSIYNSVALHYTLLATRKKNKTENILIVAYYMRHDGDNVGGFFLCKKKHPRFIDTYLYFYTPIDMMHYQTHGTRIR